MRAYDVLHGLRVGCVQYLNAKPLIVPYEGEVAFEHPGRLADMLAAGEIDVALIPVYEALRQPEFPIVDGVAIASRGAVYSVFLAYCGDVRDLKEVVLDPASRTSNHLVQVILSEFHGVTPEYRMGTGDEQPGAGRGALLIGNQAIRFREEEREGVRYMDLGEEWIARTGLPFVYAVWQVRPEVANVGGVADALRAAKKAGMCRVKEIAGAQRCFDPAFAERYLTQHIQFDLGAEEKAGLEKFRELLQKQGFVAESDVELRFV